MGNNSENEWELEYTGFTRQTIGYLGVDGILEGSSISQVIETIDRLRYIFGDNFEKLYELQRKYDGGHKQYFKEIKKGKCRCGSCDDIYEWWICVSR